MNGDDEGGVGGPGWNQDRPSNPEQAAAAPAGNVTPLRQVPSTEADRLIARFERFNEENPIVFEALHRAATEWCRNFGRSVVGPSLIFGKVRWEVALRTNDPVFKLNNDFQAFFTRLIMYRYPELEGLFRTRRAIADTWIADLKRREQGEAA